MRTWKIEYQLYRPASTAWGSYSFVVCAHSQPLALFLAGMELAERGLKVAEIRDVTAQELY